MKILSRCLCVVVVRVITLTVTTIENYAPITSSVHALVGFDPFRAIEPVLYASV